MFIGIDPELACAMLREEKVIGYDTETSGLDHGASVCGYVITAIERGSCYVPVRHEGGGNIPDVESFELTLAALFRDRQRRGFCTVGHNLAFDYRMSAKHGVILHGPLEDTMISEGLIDDIARGFGLDDCADRHGVTAKRGSELYVELARRFGGLPDRKSMANFYRMPGDHPLVVDYAAGDGVTTLELWRAQQEHLDAKGLRRVHAVECALIPHLGAMNHRGIKIDTAYAEKAKDLIDDKLLEARGRLPPGFNVRSPKALEEMFRAQGVSSFAQTAGGKPSFTEKWLDTQPLGEAILGVRRLDKAWGTFVLPIVETLNQNGRLHPVLHQSKGDDYGAIGGRLSCSEPNLQAFPKRNKTIGAIVRPLLIPDYGYMGEADFSQQEPRFFTHFSKDPTLLDGYNSTPIVDIHDNTNKLLGLNDRMRAKTLCMGILNGMGKRTLAGHMRCDEAAAANYLYDFFLAYPGIATFQRQARAVYQDRGYIKTILGRRAHLDDSKFVSRAVSRIIQGSAADHTKLGLLRMCEYADAVGGINILLTIHDSFIWQSDWGADHPKLREMIASVEAIAQEEFNLRVPLPMEVVLGDSWASASYGSKVKTAETWL